jgi:hypothetical protein
MSDNYAAIKTRVLEECATEIETLKAKVQELETAARAVVGYYEMTSEHPSEAVDNLAKLLRPIVYQEGEIPLDRAGRPMYDKYGAKLDIEDR